MAQMKRITKVLSVVVGVLLISLVIVIYGLFHGYFDTGQFEIKEVQWSSPNQVAVLAERSDHDALGSLDYFVLTGDHLLSPAELRHAYYGNAVVFAAETDCLKLHWDGPNRLVIRCAGSALARDHINAQRRQSGHITISYENIPLK
jgi:hypothetical protein